MTSVHFHPHIGGIESVTEYLAGDFFRQNNDVTVITNLNS